MMYSTTNWLGQEIKTNDIVYYGARSGDTSVYRIGIVTKLSDKIDTRTKKSVGANARVLWIGERKYSIRWINDGPMLTRESTIDANSLTLVDINTLGRDAQERVASVI